jgi:hypothetical protein
MADRQQRDPGSDPGQIPTPEGLRAELDGLDQEERKVVGALIVVMMREPARVREREWLLEAYAHIASQALEMGDEQLEQLRDWVRTHRDRVLNASFRLFLRVAEDLRSAAYVDEDGEPAPPTLGQATVLAMTYFAGPL